MNMSVPCAYFSVYYRKSPVYANDWILPIQAGYPQTHEELGILKDCDGINIAEKNPNYGELTAHYWVWKNFLPSFTGDYIGFGHYRRFLSLSNKWSERIRRWSTLLKSVRCLTVFMSYDEFSRQFASLYTPDSFCDFCGDADVIVPEKPRFWRKMHILRRIFRRILRSPNPYTLFVRAHPKRDLDKCLAIIARRHPSYVPYCDEFFSGRTPGWNSLNFILRKELFADWCEWIFDILGELEKECDWSKYNTYMTIRTPAYIAERLFCVWLLKQQAENGVKVKGAMQYLLTENGRRSDILSSPTSPTEPAI